MRSFPSPICSAANRTTSPSSLSEKLKELVPCEASKILFCASGSEANDMQMKLTWYYNNARGRQEKKKIISRHQGLSRRDHRLGLA